MELFNQEEKTFIKEKINKMKKVKFESWGCIL